MAAVAAAVAVMGLVDAVWRPGYLIKSIIKAFLFIGLPLLHAHRHPQDRGRPWAVRNAGLGKAVGAGLAVYALIMAAYLLMKDHIDLSAVSGRLSGDVGVTAANFVWVALYITVVNSLMEEFFFRYFAFMMLARHVGRPAADIFSAAAFALYHVAMMLGWFDAGLVAAAIAALAAGGLLLNRCDRRSGTIWPSWLIHLCANLAINTVGFILLGLL